MEEVQIKGKQKGRDQVNSGFRLIQILTGKEIRDILRDKKTLVIMVAMPMLLYPLMIIGMALVMSSMMRGQETQTYRILYDAQEEMEAVAEDLQRICRELEEETVLEFIPVDSSGEAVPDTSPETSEVTVSDGATGASGAAVTGGMGSDGATEIPEEIVSVRTTEDTEADSSYWEEVIKGKGDVLLRAERMEGKIHLWMEYYSADQTSSHAADFLRDVVEQYEGELLEEGLLEHGLTAEFLTPVAFEQKDLASHSETMGISIGGSLGMMLMLTIMLGAFYPVIDIVTGEKERGTLETLLTLPVTNFQMIMSKFLAVSLFACLTAVLSILSLGGSIAFLIGSVAGEAGQESLGIEPAFLLSAIPLLLLVVLVTALLLSAVSMCFCIFAKSFKEANNYITPVMLIVMFGSMASMLPGLELDYRTALIPVVNVSLLIRDIIAQKLAPSLAATTIVSNAAFSILTIWILARIYRSENVLFQDGFQSFSLFEKRSDIKQGTIPKTGDLILAVAVLLLLILYLGTAFSARSMVAGTMVNQLLILALPLVLVWYMKTDWRQLFACRRPKLKHTAGGILLYVGTFSVTLLLGFVLTKWMPQSTEALEESFTLLMEAPFVFLLFLMAVMPALGEEVFFRGLLFGSWKFRLGPVPALLLSSLVFGAFHLSLVKLLPTALLGACFAYITWRSGSIYPAMCLHFLNNLLSLVTMKFPEQAESLLPVLMKTEVGMIESIMLIVIGVASVACGALLLRREKEEKQY